MKLLRYWFCFLSLIGFMLSSTLLAAPAGTFVPLSSVSTGIKPQCVAYSPLFHDQLFAAVANYQYGVSVYQVDRFSGNWTPVAGSPFNAAIQSNAVAYSPVVNDRLFAAVANAPSSSSLVIYQVEASSGAFTEVASESLTSESNPFALSFSPLVNNQLFLAVTDRANYRLLVYLVDLVTGALSPVGSYSTLEDPFSVAYSPLFEEELFLAQTNASDAVSVYRVNQTTGALAELATSPFTSTGRPVSVAYSPVIDGSLFAAVANSVSGDVSVYQVNPSSGIFEELSDSPFATDTLPRSVAYSPLIHHQLLDPLFAATANFQSNSVVTYGVDSSTGAFSQIGDPSDSGTGPVSLAYSPLFGGNLFAATANFSANNASIYRVIIPPFVSQLTPNRGSTLGGTSVVISGYGFCDVTAVFFGDTSAVSFTIDSADKIIAIAPAGVGVVDVSVVTTVGTSPIYPNDQFTYDVEPEITQLTPSTGSCNGGTLVSILGRGFSEVQAVDFGLKPAKFRLISDRLIEAISPSGMGEVFVTVKTARGASTPSSVSRFTYIPLPPIVPPPPPLNARGCQRVKSSERKGLYALNILRWKAPQDPRIVKYEIYQDASLNKRIGVVLSSQPTLFKIAGKIGKKKSYYLVSLDEAGVMSPMVKVNVKNFCCETVRESRKECSSSAEPS